MHHAIPWVLPLRRQEYACCEQREVRTAAAAAQFGVVDVKANC